jgi:hypothetical protein
VLEQRTRLLRVVQATVRRLMKEVDGRRAYGQRLKVENLKLRVALQEKRKLLAEVGALIDEHTPYSSRTPGAVLRVMRWLIADRAHWRGRAERAEAAEQVRHVREQRDVLAARLQEGEGTTAEAEEDRRALAVLEQRLALADDAAPVPYVLTQQARDELYAHTNSRALQRLLAPAGSDGAGDQL